MKTAYLLAWLSAAVMGISAGAVSYGCAAGAGIIAAAETGEDTTDSGLSYTYDTVTKEATITGYTGTSPHVTIPEQIGSYNVTKIGASAFAQKGILTITIPDTVTEIGKEAFLFCYNLKTLSLPQVQTVGESSFRLCSNLESISMPQVRTISKGAFFRCLKLTSVSAPLAETIGVDAFCRATALTSISLPNAKTIDSYAFYSDTNLAHISIPNAEVIRSYAFNKCIALTSFSASKVKTVGDFAFMGCTALTSFHMNNAETIGYGAFRNCTSLEYVSLPYSVTEVEPEAFADCTGMKTLQIFGPTKLGANAVYRCSSLIGVTLSEESYTDPITVAFYHCPKLERINGIPVFTFETDSQGRSYPVLSSDPGVQTAIRRHFGNSIDVGFANDYSTALCNYVVETETDPWMNDALKARQLHDWLVRHCEYSNGKSGMSGAFPCSPFLSYGINLRGEGIGGAVCAGYATAYSMLLAAADIESHRIHGSGHEWNVVKIGGEYYQIDPTWDDPVYSIVPSGFVKHANPYSTDYTYFMKSYDEMVKVESHGVQELNTSEYDYHPLLAKYTCSDPDIAKRCTKSLRDENQDGIADYDFDLDGTWFQYDFQDDLNAYNNVFSFLYAGAPANANAMDYANGKLPEIVSNLHELHWSFLDFVSNCGPHDQTVETGDTATFRVSLFGDSLSYQWQYQNAGSSAWTNSTLSGANTASVSTTATDSKHGRKYRCVVTNQKGDTLTFGPATLFVTPKITKQPANATASIDSPVSFSVKANGSGLTYQWQYMTSGSSEWKNSTASGAKTATVSNTATEARNFMMYRCIITNQKGLSVTSDAAVLFVAPKITQQPADATASIDSPVSFSVKASGSGLTYQWQYKSSGSSTWKDSTASGAKTATVSNTATEARNGMMYRCIITNKSGISVTSDAAALYTAPKITQQPADATASIDSPVSFSVKANGSGLTYQWQYKSSGSSTWKDSTVSGARTATVSNTATEARNGMMYRCIITNKFGISVTSDAAALYTAPKITQQPADATASIDSPVSFSVKANGSGLTYQWQYKSSGSSTWKDSTVSGARTATVSNTATEARNGMMYRCIITNKFGVSVISAEVTLYTAPKITQQPADATAAIGENAAFTVKASGTGLTYQWQYQADSSAQWKNCASAAQNASYSSKATEARNGRKYRCIITNKFGVSVTSDAATLTVS